jgi:UDP-N-acetylglucosamine transferase subunit ALG13
MIFVTVGMSHFPFDRLVEAVGPLATGSEPLIVQHGAARVRPSRAVCHAFVPFEEMQQYMRLARVVISHGGVGSVVLALLHGKRPLVVPRRRAFFEAVDDHQVAFARRLDSAGFVSLVEDPAALVGHERLVEGSLEGADPLKRSEEPAAEIRRYLFAQLGMRPAGTPVLRIEEWEGLP